MVFACLAAATDMRVEGSRQWEDEGVDFFQYSAHFALSDSEQ